MSRRWPVHVPSGEWMGVDLDEETEKLWAQQLERPFARPRFVKEEQQPSSEVAVVVVAIQEEEIALGGLESTTQQVAE